MVCRYKFFYAEYFYLFAVFSLFYYYFHHRFYFTTYFNKSPTLAGLFRQSEQTRKCLPFYWHNKISPASKEAGLALDMKSGAV